MINKSIKKKDNYFALDELLLFTLFYDKLINNENNKKLFMLVQYK